MTRPYGTLEQQRARLAVAAEMADLHRHGLSIRAIAKRYGVRPTAIKNRLVRFGFPIFTLADRSAGSGLAAARRVASRKANADARALQKWGCSHKQYLALRKKRKPTRAFAYQKRSANDRGVGWEFNLWQWWTVWQESGHWDERGKSASGRVGYVMCRKGDAGPYSPSNIYIATSSQNIRDGYVNRGGARSKPVGAMA